MRLATKSLPGEQAINWLWSVLALLAMVLCWLPLAGAYFCTDDFILLEGSLRIWRDSPGVLPWLRTVFLEVGVMDYNYRPLSTHLFYLVQQKIFGLNPLPYHLSLMLLHGLSALAVAGIARGCGLSRVASGFVGFFYLTRDALFGTVAWIAGVQDVLLTTLGTVAAWALVKFVNQGKIRWQVVSLLFFILALFAKEMAFPLPFMVMVLALGVAGGGDDGQRLRRAALASWPHWLAWLVFWSFRVMVVPINTQQYPLGVSALLWMRPGVYAFWTFFSSFSFAWADSNEGLFFSVMALVGSGLLFWGITGAFNRRNDDPRARVALAGLLWWSTGILFVSLQKSRFGSNYLALPAIGGALAVGAGLELLLSMFSVQRWKNLIYFGVAMAAMGICARVNHLKNEEIIPSGGYYAPLSSEIYREIRQQVESLRPGLVGCKRVIWWDYDDPVRLVGNPDGLGYRRASTIAAMLRVMFNRPELTVIFTRPAGSSLLALDNGPERVVALEEVLADGVGASDLILSYDAQTNRLTELRR